MTPVRKLRAMMMLYLCHNWLPTANTSDDSLCYNEYGRAQLCRPDFHDLAYKKSIYVSHTCGVPPRTFCRPNLRGQTCDVCDASDATRSHPQTFLTDLHNESNITCWIADPVQSQENVTLVLSLGKTHDITYVSLQFCSLRPESMAIYKSMDFGKSWQPYQFYSGDCENTYGRPVNGYVGEENEQEALCTDGHLIRPHHGGRIAFSTLAGRPSAPDVEFSPVLQAWVVATDIKVEFNGINTMSGRPWNSQYYGVSNLMVGGRCHCNGHANRCSKGLDGHICECMHNTAGPDCQVCKPFFNDRPWRPATTDSANECIVCNCNLHSRTCEFNMELFKLSGGRSGGVCINCRHNTAGRYCHYCKEGYFKDPNKPLTHRKTCQRCNCHPHGSRGRVCDQISGQCPCKEGVSGRSCDKCSIGYISTKSNIVPCIAMPQNVMSQETAAKAKDVGCSQCRRVPLRARRYCRKDYAIKVTVVRVAKMKPKGWVRVTVNINTSFKSTAIRFRRGDGYLWVRLRDHKCRCPRLKRGRTYFIAGKIRRNRLRRSIIVDSKSIVVPWKHRLLKKIYKFKKLQRRNRCR